MEENRQHFQHRELYYFKKGKNTTEMQKKKNWCSVWRKCCDWLNVSKVACVVLCWRFLAGQCSIVGKTSWSWKWSNRDINWEQLTLYLIYSKYPSQWNYWWKWKMCLLFYGKKPNGLFGQPSKINGTFVSSAY